MPRRSEHPFSAVRHIDDMITAVIVAFVLQVYQDGMVEADAVHAEDMSLIRLPDGRLRMFYAACDRSGVWRIASAVTVD